MSAPELILISPCSGPVRKAAPAGVEAVIFALAEGLRREFRIQVLATHDSALPADVVLRPCTHAALEQETGRLLRERPDATFCDHSGAALDGSRHGRFFRVFHVEPRYVFTPDAPDRCAFVSAYLRGLFAEQRASPFERCPILANGVAPPDAPPSATGGAGVIYLGRLNRLKGIDLGVAACASLGLRLQIHGGLGLEVRPDIVFNDLPLLADLARLHPAAFRYHGPLSDPATKQALLAGADAVLIPSREAESCSLVALEAVAAGTPVVTFRRGGVVEYLGDHPGAFFAPHTGHDGTDADALARALRGALGAPRAGPSLPARYRASAMVERYRRWLFSAPAASARSRGRGPR
jgi:glycosyltransferase involved in cell wall biosynthesis